MKIIFFIITLGLCVGPVLMNVVHDFTVVAEQFAVILQ